MGLNYSNSIQSASLLYIRKHTLAVCALFFLLSNCIFADTSSELCTNTPNIYVDYVKNQASYDAAVAAVKGLGYWIWAKDVLNKQTIYLWKSFKVPKSNPVVHAQLSISADNAFTVWIDGCEIGGGSDWRTLSVYEMSGKLAPGTHVLTVEGFNDCDKAGVIVGLSLTLADGKTQRVRSDKTWRIVPSPVSGWQTATQPGNDWPPARTIAHLGEQPWWAVPATVAHIQSSLPEPVPFWRTSRFQYILFVGCAMLTLIGLSLLIQLVIQSRTHAFVQIERDRIARDLHDDLGSRITELLLTGEAAQIKHNRHPDNGSLIEPMQKICKSARDIVSTIDETVWIVNSGNNKLNDFATRICKHTERFLKSASIRCRFDVDYELPPRKLTQFIRRNLFLAFKEALCNAVKHSHATELTVRVRLDNSAFLICVEDNGIGFDEEQIDTQRHGLRNLTLRMKEIGGSSQIISQPGKGCKIVLNLPLNRFRLRRLWSAYAHSDDSSPSQNHAPGQTKDAPSNPITLSNV